MQTFPTDILWCRMLAQVTKEDKKKCSDYKEQQNMLTLPESRLSSADEYHRSDSSRRPDLHPQDKAKIVNIVKLCFRRTVQAKKNEHNCEIVVKKGREIFTYSKGSPGQQFGFKTQAN